MGYFLVEVKPVKNGALPFALNWKKIHVSNERHAWIQGVIDKMNEGRKLGKDGFLYLVDDVKTMLIAKYDFPNIVNLDYCLSPEKDDDGNMVGCGDCDGCRKWKDMVKMSLVLADISLPDKPKINRLKTEITTVIGLEDLAVKRDIAVDPEEVMNLLHAKPLRRADGEKFMQLG